MFNFKILQHIKQRFSEIHPLLDYKDNIFSIDISEDTSKLKKQELICNGYAKVNSFFISTVQGDLRVLEAFFGSDPEPIYYAFEDCLELRRKILLNENNLYLVGLMFEKPFASDAECGYLKEVVNIDSIYEFELFEDHEDYTFNSIINTNYFVTCYSPDYLSSSLRLLSSDEDSISLKKLKEDFFMEGLFSFFDVDFDVDYNMQDFIDIISNKNKIKNF